MSEQEPSVEVPRLSPSIGHKLITKSALAAWAAHRLLGNFRKPPTDTQISGRGWHAAILGDEESIEVLEFDTYRSAAASTCAENPLTGRSRAAPTGADAQAPSISTSTSNRCIGLPLVTPNRAIPLICPPSFRSIDSSK